MTDGAVGPVFEQSWAASGDVYHERPGTESLPWRIEPETFLEGRRRRWSGGSHGLGAVQHGPATGSGTTCRAKRDAGTDGPESDDPGHGNELVPLRASSSQPYVRCRYIEYSEVYENTQAEKIIGEVLDRTGRRKDVYLVTKNTAYRKSMGTGVSKMFEQRLNASLERLKTDHVNCYYLHGLAGDQIELLRDPGVKAAFENLKKQGKTRFCGLSCHDGRLPEILETAAECGWIDQVMFKYNFRDVGGRDRHDELQHAIDKAMKANLGLRHEDPGRGRKVSDKMKLLQEKGFKKEVAAVKSVWMDGRIHVAVSEMTTRSDLRENVAASVSR